MKTLPVILSTALFLGAGPLPTKASGCYYNGCNSEAIWPFVTFGVGLGLGVLFSHASEPYPSFSTEYVYAPPVAAPPQSIPAETPPPPPKPEWIPISPGPGHWVPDPQPYRYEPTKTAAASPKPPASKPPQAVKPVVTVSKRPDGVPIYINR